LAIRNFREIKRAFDSWTSSLLHLRSNPCSDFTDVTKCGNLGSKWPRNPLYLSHQGRTEVRWRPGQEAGLTPTCSNLRSFGSKCTVLKKVLVTLLGLFRALRSHSAANELFPLCPPSLRPCFTLILAGHIYMSFFRCFVCNLWFLFTVRVNVVFSRVTSSLWKYFFLVGLHSSVYIINFLLGANCMCSWVSYLFDCKPRFINFFHHLMRLTFFISLLYRKV